MTEGIKEALKRTVVEAGLRMVEQGLTVGTWGNISVRDSATGLMYISPSAIDYEAVRLADIVVLNDELEVVDCSARPSIEKRMHLAVYRAREDVNAVIHTHPLYSSVLGVNGMALPGISEDFVQIVGDRIICSEYALPGTQELAESVLEGLGNRNAVFLPNHGTLCVGKDMDHAFKVCHVVEKTAHIFILAKSIGTPNLISDEDIREMQRFAQTVYGQR
ncbi:MAG: class II aldolase/adducin family protein [Anaerolineae bacterium]|jgi:L-fuculose-phosphate aldolase